MATATRALTSGKQKRPLPSGCVDSSEEDVSDVSDALEDSSLGEWLPSPSLSCPDSPRTTSSACEQDGQRAVIASPPRKTQFASWEALDAYLATYQAESFQIFRVRTNTTVTERNGVMERNASKAPRIPADWQQYAKTFVCTHYGKYESKASNKRPRQASRAAGCKAQINACVQVVHKSTLEFAVRITKCRLEHNHTLSDYSFESHSSHRVNLDETTLTTVDVLREAGAKKTSIVKFMKDNSDSTRTPKTCTTWSEN